MVEEIYINKVRDESQKDGFRYEYWGLEGTMCVCELQVLKQKRDKDGNWNYSVSLKKIGLQNKDYLSTKMIEEGLKLYQFIERDKEKKENYHKNDSKKWIDKMEPKEKIKYENLQNQVMELCNKMKEMEEMVKQRELEKKTVEKLNNFGIDNIELLEQRLEQLKKMKELKEKEEQEKEEA